MKTMKIKDNTADHMPAEIMQTAQDYIEHLNLKPHPEGGWYAETFNNSNGVDERGSLSVIYYLLEKGQAAHWHRVRDADEVWLWHAGSPLTLYTKPDDGKVSKTVLGLNAAAGQVPQLIIGKGLWQSASAIEGWVLVSCVVAPAFVFDKMDFAPRGFEPGFGI